MLKLAAAALSLLLLPGLARAHCDTLDGPVVKTARAALESGKLNPVLAWVRAGDVPEIRAAFQRTLAARKLGPAAREVADTWFLETLVRVHRAGEGAPFTGLKPAGQDLGPAVPAADRAIGARSPEAVEELLVESVRHGLHRRYQALASRTAPGEDVAAGRAWVAAYVPYVHWVEGVYDAAAKGPAGQGEAGAHEGHGEAAGQPEAKAGAHDHAHR